MLESLKTLSLIPGALMKEGENRLHVLKLWHMYIHIQTYIDTDTDTDTVMHRQTQIVIDIM